MISLSLTPYSNFMNLRDLKYLVAVADYKSFRKAADATFVSQPTLSMQIKKLEDFLQVTLIERTNKKVLMTPIGLEIVSIARKILQDADNISTIAKAAKNPLIGELKLGAFPTLAPYLFPNIIVDIVKKFPDLKMLLVEEKTEILTNKLKVGQIDLAFLALPINEPELEFVKVFSEDFYLAVPKNHKLAKQKSVTTKDISDEKIMLLEDGHCLREQALEVCSTIGALEDKSFRATSLETLRAMVSAGSGITLMPKIAIKDDKNIAYIPFESSKNNSTKPQRDIALVWRKSSVRKELFKKIAEIIKIK
jgi:LysR family hydrogen peroxide-inducible transcriptional activator